MVRIPDFDPIDYLVTHRFPNAKAIRFPPSLSGAHRVGGPSADTRRHLIAEMDSYKNELESKSNQELQALVEAERAKELAQRMALAAAADKCSKSALSFQALTRNARLIELEMAGIARTRITVRPPPSITAEDARSANSLARERYGDRPDSEWSSAFRRRGA